ncbi:hypothetical protein [Actinopolymorpha alba]|uniref:hypothetical protein n=1 Tax=Actinopolymorpha alba TaxID=533267 RepID=UPI00035E864F|nr:hypothetical protein [Actinopolymorpha alba]
MSTENAQWFYCLRHHRVEPFEGCKAADRLGPYPSVAEAEGALEKVAQRNENWDNDPRWNDDDNGADDER